jgi:hypothetical protein
MKYYKPMFIIFLKLFVVHIYDIVILKIKEFGLLFEYNISIIYLILRREVT